MLDTDLFTRLLHVEAPWRVSRVEFDHTKIEVTVYVGVDAAADVICPQCRQVRTRCDSLVRRWHHVDTMEYRTYLECDVPRFSCPEHGITEILVPWVEGSSRDTLAGN